MPSKNNNLLFDVQEEDKNDKNFENKKWLFYKDFKNNQSYGFDAFGDWVFNKKVLKDALLLKKMDPCSSFLL